MAGCGDVLSLEDLQTAKKHQIFEAEVITGKAGGVAGGATIGTATNPITGQTQQTLPSILADLGFDVQSWTSSTGGVLASANQVFLNDTPGSLGLGDYYAWGGTFPKTVPAGTDPALPTSGYIMRSSRLAGVQAREALRRSYAEAGYNLVDGSFEAGGTLVNANDVLLQERTGKAFSGPAGTVAAGTNPASVGFVDKSGSVQDFIDAQYTTVAELATGRFQVGQYVRLSDRAMILFKLQSGGVPNGKGILNAGNGNTAIIQESLLFGSDVDISILGYNYDNTDVTPYLDEFLTLFNGTGTTAVISDSNTLFGSPSWLNEIPKDIHIKSAEGVTVTSNTPQAGNEAAFNALINLRGTRGVEQTTVSADINEGDDFINVVDAAGVTEGSYIEIDFREQDIVSPYSILVKQAAALVLVTGVVGNRIYIDYVFPFDMVFQPSAKKVVYKNITPALNCSVQLNYVDTTVNNSDACFGVHMYHAANCKTDIRASGIIANAIMHTYTYNCESDGFFKDARVTTGGYGYGCQVSASTRHHFGSLIGNNVRHTLDYSNAGWCTGDYCHDSQSVSGLTTHGISEHNIHLKNVLTDSIFLAESGAGFGYHNKNITIDNLVCDTLTCGYVENLIVNGGKILTEFEVRRGGTYTLTSEIPLMDYHGRNGREGTLSKQGVNLIKGSLTKYVAANLDYLTTSFTRLKNNVSSPSTSHNVLNVKHSHPIRETHREIFSGVGFSYQWNDGDFANNDVAAVPLIATSRLTGGVTVIKVNGVKLSGGSLAKLLQLQQFNDTGTNKLIADVSGNFMSDMVVDSSSINGTIYDIRGIVYGNNVRVNSPALVASYVTNNDVTVTI